MKIIYNPFITSNAFVSQSLLWDTVAAGDAALLEQLLMRAGLPQTVADEDPEKDDVRLDPYIAALSELGPTLFSESLHSEPKGTAKQLLKWRDLLVMAGWTAETTINAQSDKLRVLAQADAALNAYPSRADRWRDVNEYLRSGKHILSDNDSVEVRIPKTLIPPLIAEVLNRLPNVSYKMEKLDTTLHPEGHPCIILTPNEQYEAWQLLVQLPYDHSTMLVCQDDKRLNDTMRAIGGDQWRMDRVGCPHSAATIFDGVDTPDRIVWLDCAGNGLSANPYDFLSVADMQELAELGIHVMPAEIRSATETQWLYSLLNHIHEWILVAPKYHMGETLEVHPVITSLKQDNSIFAAACVQGQTILLPQTNNQLVQKLSPIGAISINPSALSKIPSPSDSYSAIDTLINAPFDFVINNVVGLAAPEDDQEPNEHLVEGHIAHKVVELLINKGDSDAYSIAEIQSRFNTRYDEIFSQALADENLKDDAQFLLLPENANMLTLFREDARKSIAHLIDVIQVHHLMPIRSEYEFHTPFKPFDNPHGFIDMLLKDTDGNLVIFDLKWSTRDVFQKAIENGEAYQLYMYRHAVEAQTHKKVAWYAYYLFPLMELYTEPVGAQPRWEDWLQKWQDRLLQLSNGSIQPAVENSDKDKYPKHLVLKNRNIK